METKQKIKLIEGIFSAKDAREIIMNLYASKINFHLLKNFSSNERFGKDDETAIKRIPELKETMNFVAAFFQEAESKNKNLIVKSSISIEFADMKKK